MIRDVTSLCEWGLHTNIVGHPSEEFTQLYKASATGEGGLFVVTLLLAFLTCVLLTSVVGGGGHCAGRGDSLLDLNRPLDAEGNPVYVSSGSGGSQPGVTPTQSER